MHITYQCRAPPYKLSPRDQFDLKKEHGYTTRSISESLEQ